MTREELATFDGREGRKAYVAVNGKVYDFSASDLWKNGDHMQQHQAGQDLTEALWKAPHVRAVVERYPVVDELVEAPPPPEKKSYATMIGGVLFLAVLFIIGILLLR